MSIFNFSYVRGHQDRTHSVLLLQEFMNIIFDIKAKVALWEQVIDPKPVYHIQDNRHYLAGVVVELENTPIHIVSNLKESLQEIIAKHRAK